ncbi:hypothetical protein A2U01_0111940, partial [Trifolium medium]|nr:hypothetical protein [Trifolium medium]
GFHYNGRITSGGWCFRDDEGQFVRAGTYWKNSAYTQFMKHARSHKGSLYYELGVHHI